LSRRSGMPARRGGQNDGGKDLLFFSLCPQAVLRVLRVSAFLSVLRVSAVKAFAFDSISNLKFPISNRLSVHLWFPRFCLCLHVKSEMKLSHELTLNSSTPC
jgi:hypothetical protein